MHKKSTVLKLFPQNILIIVWYKIGILKSINQIKCYSFLCRQVSHHKPFNLKLSKFKVFMSKTYIISTRHRMRKNLFRINFGQVPNTGRLLVCRKAFCSPKLRRYYSIFCPQKGEIYVNSRRKGENRRVLLVKII